MALSQKGAKYDYREHIKDPHVQGALDDLASQVQAVRNQGQFGLDGSPSPPSAPAQLSASVDSNGNFSATISPRAAVTGTLYLLEHDTSPNFPSPVTVDLGISTTWKQNLNGQKLYFRCCARLATSDNSPFIYYGSETAPIGLQG